MVPKDQVLTWNNTPLLGGDAVNRALLQLDPLHHVQCVAAPLGLCLSRDVVYWKRGPEAGGFPGNAFASTGGPRVPAIILILELPNVGQVPASVLRCMQGHCGMTQGVRWCPLLESMPPQADAESKTMQRLTSFCTTPALERVRVPLMCTQPVIGQRRQG
jgi:hypothetical protein